MQYMSRPRLLLFCVVLSSGGLIYPVPQGCFTATVTIIGLPQGPVQQIWRIGLYITIIHQEDCNITVTSQWARWRLKLPASRLFAQPFVQAQIKENKKVPRHWPLWGESTCDRWIPLTKGQWRGKCFHLMTSSRMEPEQNKMPLSYFMGIVTSYVLQTKYVSLITFLLFVYFLYFSDKKR